MKIKKGFTLIELMVVIAIIAALAVTVFVALNPSQQLKDARDARRSSDVDTILTAIHLSIINNGGATPGTLGSIEAQLGTATTGCAIATGGCAVTPVACLNLTAPLAAYLRSIPIDPLSGTVASTRYSAIMDTNGIVTIRACATGTGTTEGATNISASR